jgi:Pyruvate/2-oxoacid:ferredoxin oxidoreductase delta subunit
LLEKLNLGYEEANNQLNSFRLSLEKEIVENTLLDEKDKEKLFSECKLKLGEENRKKIASVVIEELRNEEAINEQIKLLLEKGQNYKQLLQKKKEASEKLRNYQEVRNNCANCQPYCPQHTVKVQQSSHADCPHCGKKIKE